MNIQLSKPELARFVEEQVRAGRFASPSEVIEAGLAQLMLDAESQGLDGATLDALDAAEAQIERGECRDWKDASADMARKYLGR